MGDGFNFENLKTAILALSRATDWATARREWVLTGVYEADQPETCLCEHFPIIEICVIKNTITQAVAEVGNVCVKRFLGIRSDLIFAALKRIRKDITKSLNEDAIVLCLKNHLINQWGYEFLQDTKRKRSLSERQMSKRMDINRKVLTAMAHRGLRT
ncbi:hypothetical protein [Bradyrhizobium zhanjiangense]|uniref:hypothetical protein n=1 Tax=Bradyrhizobium zhanjiangense TaxID=1325107 RepID=UPI001009110B|nr:hypothetical protein [Bradyrhizobium zhanjiangense]